MTHIFRPSYRADIDGLRAIAILSVIISHAFQGVMSGGFVGVDIFFVISGFLISNIIFKSLETGSFSYIEFYNRRIKRIFPALITVLLFCFLIGYFILLPVEFNNLGKNVVGGAFFISNIILWGESGYFDTASGLKPFLNLWSLGVEEQYYIIWPVLVVLIWKRSNNFLLIVLPIFIGSFLLNIFVINHHSGATFYSPVTRFWELMIGSLLAFIVLHNIRILPSKISCNVVSWTGLCFLIAGFFLIDSHKVLPGLWTLLPTMGTFLLIYAGNKSFVNSRLLSNKVLVFVGLISYPLYLWHWPLLAYARIVNLNGTVEKMAIVILSFILAILTYNFLEKPIRSGFSHKGAPIDVSRWLVSTMLATAAIGGASYIGILQPYHNSQNLKLISTAIGEWEYPGDMRKFKFRGSEFFRINNESIDQKNSGQILFLGDSNMAQYYSNIEALSHRTKKSIIFATEDGCPPIPNVYRAIPPQSYHLVDDVMVYTSNPEVKVVVIGAAWTLYFGKDSTYYFKDQQNRRDLFLNDSAGSKAAFSSLEEMLSKFSSMGKTVYLLLNIPVGDALDPKNMVNRSMYNGSPFFSVNYGQLTEKDIEKNQYIDNALIKIAHKTNAIVIDPKKFLCPEGRCPSILPDGQPIYKDNMHLRPSFVRTQIHFLDQIIK